MKICFQEIKKIISTEYKNCLELVSELVDESSHMDLGQKWQFRMIAVLFGVGLGGCIALVATQSSATNFSPAADQQLTTEELRISKLNREKFEEFKRYKAKYLDGETRTVSSFSNKSAKTSDRLIDDLITVE